MTVVCKPVGRGNWKPMVLTYPGGRLPGPMVLVGQVFHLGGVKWRVCEVRP